MIVSHHLNINSHIFNFPVSICVLLYTRLQIQSLVLRVWRLEMVMFRLGLKYEPEIFLIISGLWITDGRSYIFLTCSVGFRHPALQ